MRQDSDTAAYADFLLESTQALWERRGLAETAAAVVHPQAVLRDAWGVGHGPESVLAEARPMLVAFPDLAWLGEDVIAAPTPGRGFLGAQRLLATGTHRGAGVFGAATGREVAFREMAFCYAKAEKLCDVWRLRDSAALLRGLGQTPADWARAQVARLDPALHPFRPGLDVPGPYTGAGNDDDWGVAYGDLLGRIMEGAHGIIARQYDRACQIDPPGGQVRHGWYGADALWLELRAALPSARFRIHHRLGIEEPLMPPRAALHWSLQGRHDGWGVLGAPTGAELFVAGMSMAEFGPRGLRREWVIWDEAALWLQIAQACG